MRYSALKSTPSVFTPAPLMTLVSRRTTLATPHPLDVNVKRARRGAKAGVRQLLGTPNCVISAARTAGSVGNIFSTIPATGSFTIGALKLKFQ